MGVAALWPLLRAEEMVEYYLGSSADDLATIVSSVFDTAVAVDLSTWIVQADSQQALSALFSREERCMKVAFERSLQMLRHGCLPVIVAEGRPPEEKRAAQRSRFASRNGYAGGGTAQGAAQFMRLGRAVADLLEQLGLPVFHAPGEAEAVCAALNAAGCVDACASKDGDCLLYGAETLLPSLKLLTSTPRDCELKRVRLASIRRRLRLKTGGARALGVLAMLSGSDYDLDGAAGVGSAGGLAVARHLLQGDADDSAVLERLAAAVRRPPDAELLSLTKCTGCASCGHEGGRLNKIKRHSSRNPCACCPPAADGHCPAVAFDRCGCVFHARETERRVERILERVRGHPSFLEDAQRAIGVFEIQQREAEAYIAARLPQLGGRPGQRLRWLRRPSVRGVHAVIDRHRNQLQWDLAAIRSKLLPVLMEWDMQAAAGSSGDAGDAGPSTSAAAAAGVEFRPAEVQKVHGQRSKDEELTGAHWRYVVRWERLDADLEGLGTLQVKAKRLRSAGAAGGSPPLLSQSEGPPEVLTLRQFDERWMKEQPAEHRAVRIAAVRRLAPQLEARFQQRLAGAPASAKMKKAAGGGRAPAAAAAGKKAAATAGEEDLLQHLHQRKPGGQPSLAAAARKPSAAATSGHGYGLADGGGYSGAVAAAAAAGGSQQRPQQEQWQQHLPSSFERMQALMGKASDPSEQQQPKQQQLLLSPQRCRQPEPPAEEQEASPSKRRLTAAAAAAGAATPAGTPWGDDSFEVVLSSPESPALLPLAQRLPQRMLETAQQLAEAAAADLVREQQPRQPRQQQREQREQPQGCARRALHTPGSPDIRSFLMASPLQQARGAATAAERQQQQRERQQEEQQGEGGLFIGSQADFVDLVTPPASQPTPSEPPPAAAGPPGLAPAARQQQGQQQRRQQRPLAAVAMCEEIDLTGDSD